MRGITVATLFALVAPGCSRVGGGSTRSRGAERGAVGVRALSRARARRRWMRWVALGVLAQAAGCSIAGLFEAPPAQRCQSRVDCEASFARSDRCLVPACDTVTGLCGVTLRDDDLDGHAPLRCSDDRVANPLPADDCDDAAPAVHPGAVEACNGIDDDCSLGGGPEPAEDADGDGVFGQATGCVPTAARGDCDDADPSRRPGAIELCNGIDDDCDGAVDNEPAASSHCQQGAPPALLAYCGQARCQRDAYAGLALESSYGCVWDLSGRLGCVGELGAVVRSAPMERSFQGVSWLPDVVEVAPGPSRLCARDSTGAVRCTGAGRFGELGAGASTLEAFGTAARVEALDDAVELAAGLTHTCARRRAGQVVCWGRGERGELGAGRAPTTAYVPVAVATIDDAVSLAAGQSHTCVVRSRDGSVYCWGDNAYGQIGNGGDASAVNTPVQVQGVTGAVEVTAGGRHTCARLTNTRLRCWGDNSSGQLGDGLTSARSPPVDVPDIEGVRSVAAGITHTCAVIAPDTTVCWGNNSRGQLGALRASDERGPLVVAGLSGVRQLEAGGVLTCARLAGERVVCWGGGGSVQGHSLLGPMDLRGF